MYVSLRYRCLECRACSTYKATHIFNSTLHAECCHYVHVRISVVRFFFALVKTTSLPGHSVYCSECNGGSCIPASHSHDRADDVHRLMLIWRSRAVLLTLCRLAT